MSMVDFPTVLIDECDLHLKTKDSDYRRSPSLVQASPSLGVPDLEFRTIFARETLKYHLCLELQC